MLSMVKQFDSFIEKTADYDEYTDEDFFDVDENGIVSINYDDAIPDAVSDETGWLVYDTDYIITLNPNA